VRTPLNGILNAYQLLKTPSSANNLKILFQVLDESVTRLEKYSFIALQITRLITLKEKALDYSSVSLSDIVQECLNMVGEQSNAKGINIKVDNQSSKKIIGDKEFLKSAMVQILDNAIEYAYSDSIVKIEIKETAEKMLLSVWDQGPGFSEKALQNLFQSYSPGDNFVNDNSGLGLFFVKLLVDALSGYVSANNTSEGAYIKIELPLVK